jgi:glycosyltransferase involved in cell wall biosynthesis
MSNGHSALVSVILPAYNAGSDLLRLAVESILQQTYTRLELIAVDDGSTDNSVACLDAIRDERMRVVHQANAGRSAAMNRGRALATGTFWVGQDADDVSHPRRIGRLVEYMTDHPELAAVFTGHDLIIGDQIVAPRVAGKSPAQCRADIEAFRMPAHGPTPIFRTSMTAGFGFDVALGPAEDLDFILRVGEHYPMAVLAECLYSYRVQTNSISRVNPLRSREMERRAVTLACTRRGLDPAVYLPPVIGPVRRHLHRYREQIVPHFMESVLDARRGRQWLQAVGTAISCLRLHPSDPYYYKPLVYSFVPLSTIAFYRHRRGAPAW